MDKKYYWARVEHYRAKARESYRRNKKYHQQYWKDHPEKRREADLRCKYGITSKDYEKLYINQGGRCAICDKHQIKLSCKLCVDHCHISKTVRGLLCKRCNMHLGWYEKCQEKIENYLKSS